MQDPYFHDYYSTNDEDTNDEVRLALYTYVYLLMYISLTFEIEINVLCLQDPSNLHDHYSPNDENTNDEVNSLSSLLNYVSDVYSSNLIDGLLYL